MNKILRYLFVAAFAAVSSLSFAGIVTFDAANDKGQMVGSSTGADEVAKEGITISVSPTGSFGNGQQYRVYKGSTITIASTVGNITKVEFTCTASGTSKYGPGCFTNGSVGGYTFEGTAGTWTGDAASLSLKASSNQVRATQIVVTVNDGGGSTGKKSAGLAFNPATIDVEKGAEFTAPVFTKATDAIIKFSSDNESVATVNADGVISLGMEEGTAVITATSDETEGFYAGKATCTINVFTYNTYKKATVVESGKEYLLVAQRDGKTSYAMPLSADKTYGYLNSSSVDGLVDEIKVKSKYKDGFIFTAEGTGFSIKDAATGRYIIQQGTYKSFNTSEAPAAWNVEPQADGTFKIEMNGYFMQWGEGTYTSFGVYTEMQANAVLPYLYVLDNTTNGISNPTVNVLDSNAPIYNLAGQRVSKDTKGILIQNGRKFINK